MPPPPPLSLSVLPPLLLLCLSYPPYYPSPRHVLVSAMPASPHPFRRTQPDGTFTPPLYIRGDHTRHRLADVNGNTVMKDGGGWYVYAARDDDEEGGGGGGEGSVPTGVRVGGGGMNPEKMGMVLENGRSGREGDAIPPPMDYLSVMEGGADLAEEEEEEEEEGRSLRGSPSESESESDPEPESPSGLAPQGRRRELHPHHIADLRRQSAHRRILSAGTSADPSVLRVLAVMIRFSDHRHRRLPPPSDYRHMFATHGGHPTVADTGSVRDWYHANSRGKFEMDVHVTDWIDLPETEAYYANGNWGWNEEKMRQGFYYALDRLDRDTPGFRIEDFDRWVDGVLDAVCFVHSGVPAEWGSTDCESGSDEYNRIWSHKSWGLWTSASGAVRLSGYFVGSGVWPSGDPQGCLRCDGQRCDIAHIGVFAHELAHDLGLPDLYDGHEGGVGVGNFDCMGNSWGWRADQRYPPNLSVWTKDQLSWITKINVERTSTYQIASSSRTDRVYCVQSGYSPGESICVENRYSEGYDLEIPHDGGLGVWKLDEKAWHHEQGYPGMAGSPAFPQNGKHYRVALLASDGSYDLERGSNFGDGYDLFRPGLAGASSKIGPGGVEVTKAGGGVSKLPHPNTDTYQGGVVRSTGLTIEVTSPPGTVLTVSFSGPNLLPALDDGAGAGVEQQGADTLAVGGRTGGGGGDDDDGEACGAIDKKIKITQRRRGRTTVTYKSCSYVKGKRWCGKKKYRKACRRYCSSDCVGTIARRG